MVSLPCPTTLTPFGVPLFATHTHTQHTGRQMSKKFGFVHVPDMRATAAGIYGIRTTNSRHTKSYRIVVSLGDFGFRFLAEYESLTHTHTQALIVCAAKRTGKRFIVKFKIYMGARCSLSSACAPCVRLCVYASVSILWQRDNKRTYDGGWGEVETKDMKRENRCHVLHLIQ